VTIRRRGSSPGEELALFGDGQGAAPYPPPIHNDDRPLEVQGRRPRQHTIEQPEHVGIRVRSPAEEDEARTAGLVQRQEPRVVEIRRDDDSLLPPRYVEQLGVRGSSQSHLMGVDGVMTDGPEMRDGLGRHRHVDQKLQPVSSMVSSSARLAAYRKASSMSATSRYG
jgi:hypothetical protein